MKKYYIFFATLSALTIGLVAWETMSARNPLNDERAVTDLRSISSAVQAYESENGKLPDSLSDVSLTGDAKERSGSYEYEKSGESTYKLCATFKTKVENPFVKAYPDYPSTTPSPQYHDKGRQCFDYTLDFSINYSPTRGSSSSGASQIQEKARDSERKSDINTIHSHLEVYFATTGYYPTLANLNDDAWVKANMKGLDKEALKDPRGFGDLVTKPEANFYAYSSTPTACDNSASQCTAYVLTTTLEAGGTYVKSSLN